MTCLATQEGALMVQISRELFLSFLATQPKALQVYLQKVRPGPATRPPRSAISHPLAFAQLFALAEPHP